MSLATGNSSLDAVFSYPQTPKKNLMKLDHSRISYVECECCLKKLSFIGSAVFDHNKVEAVVQPYI